MTKAECRSWAFFCKKGGYTWQESYSLCRNWRTRPPITSRDVDGWKQYLNTASRLYKYKFDEQLLIYAQRPDATACAEMELWNEKMRRWVKAGSKGIALIRGAETGRPHLEYVFDVACARRKRAIPVGDEGGTLCTCP